MERLEELRIVKNHLEEEMHHFENNFWKKEKEGLKELVTKDELIAKLTSERNKYTEHFDGMQSTMREEMNDLEDKILSNNKELQKLVDDENLHQVSDEYHQFSNEIKHRTLNLTEDRKR